MLTSEKYIDFLIKYINIYRLNAIGLAFGDSVKTAFWATGGHYLKCWGKNIFLKRVQYLEIKSILP